MRIFIAVVMVIQLSPLVPFLFLAKYSNQELDNFRSTCVEEYITKEIQIYQDAASSGKKVYGGIDKIRSDFGHEYEKLCDKIIKYKYSNFSLYGIFAVVFLYTIPSTILFMVYSRKMSRNKVTMYFSVAILILLGMILYWDFGLNSHAYPTFCGRILF